MTLDAPIVGLNVNPCDVAIITAFLIVGCTPRMRHGLLHAYLNDKNGSGHSLSCSNYCIAIISSIVIIIIGVVFQCQQQERITNNHSLDGLCHDSGQNQ